MNEPKLLEKLAMASVASSMIVGSIIIASSAQAALVGGLGWDNGTSDFFDDVNPGDNDDFTVQFVSPQSASPETNISITSGIFEAIFPTPLAIVDLASAPEATFSYVNGQTPISVPGGTEYLYTLDNDLVFEWNNLDGDPGDVDVRFTLKAGNLFEVETDDDPGPSTEVEAILVGFEPSEAQWFIDSGVSLDGTDQTFSVAEAEFTFGQIEDQPGGTFGIEADAVEAVPEPGTILGLLAVGGLGLALKGKKQS